MFFVHHYISQLLYIFYFFALDNTPYKMFVLLENFNQKPVAYLGGPLGHDPPLAKIFFFVWALVVSKNLAPFWNPKYMYATVNSSWNSENSTCFWKFVNIDIFST